MIGFPATAEGTLPSRQVPREPGDPCQARPAVALQHRPLPPSHPAPPDHPRVQVDENKGGSIAEAEPLGEWADLLVTAQENEPRFLRQVGFPDKYAGDIGRLLDLIEGDVGSTAFFDSAEALRGEAERYASLGDALEALSSVTSMYYKRANKLAAELQKRSSNLEDEARQLEPPEPDEEKDWDRDSPGTFDIEGLFADL